MAGRGRMAGRGGASRRRAPEPRLTWTDLTGGPGDFLLVPRGAAHTFGNTGTGEARLLILHAPAMDAYFEELHRLWASEEPPATAEERARMARFGMEPA